MIVRDVSRALSRSLKRCSSKASPKKQKKQRANKTPSLRALSATIDRHERFFDAQRVVNTSIRDALAAVYQPAVRASVRVMPRAQLAAPMRQLPAPASVPKRRKRAARPKVDVAAVEFTVEALESDPHAVPQPIGPEGYRPAQCAVGHEPWGEEYQSALDEARERAAIESGDDEDAYRVLVRRFLAEHPRFAQWSAAERGCVSDFRQKHERGRRRTVTASSETRNAIADASRELGYDVRGSAEHLDRLTPSGQASYWRRLYKRTGSVDALRRAREIEARLRARRRKGAGVSTHAAG